MIFALILVFAFLCLCLCLWSMVRAGSDEDELIKNLLEGDNGYDNDQNSPADGYGTGKEALDSLLTEYSQEFLGENRENSTLKYREKSKENKGI
ncbi:MAG: hypothetical protein ACI39R_08580 [Lachnospiraceae bacterium]